LAANFSIFSLSVTSVEDPSKDPTASKIPSTPEEDKILRENMQKIESGEKFNPSYGALTWNCRYFTNRHKYDGMSGYSQFGAYSIIPIYPPVQP
jgi:hypothetical protein